MEFHLRHNWGTRDTKAGGKFLLLAIAYKAIAEKYKQITSLFVLALWLFVGALLLTVPARAQDGGPIVVDFNSGLALSGVDPVAYFINGRARDGLSQFEARFDGIVWRFVNEGNRQAFESQRHIYTPRFGGHDPVAVTKGFIAPGDPSLFLIADNRLYLFNTTQNLATFREDPRRVIDRAQRQWPRLVEQSRR